ncbi:MAG: serine/threonine protein kinase [Anaerolineae bacterium]|nr:serine/threonine protein kinase [Anaerolineae bacterium]
MDELQGTELGGYWIGHPIGRGGFGRVYQGYALDNLNKPVAIKVLHPDFAQDEALLRRFLREIRLMESLNHPNIIPILGHGRTDKYLYFVMALINGTTLENLLERQSFTPRLAWRILRPLAEALNYGHSQGILHRDVKPGNVFIERKSDGEHVYLGDFGLGKHPGVDDSLTGTGISIGTPEYMSPEAVQGTDIGPESDVYSLTVLAYELLLKALPIQKKARHHTAIAQLHEAPVTPSARRPDFPPALEEVLLKGLAKQKQDRYPTIQAFGNAFFAALKQLSAQEIEQDYAVDADPQAS